MPLKYLSVIIGIWLCVFLILGGCQAKPSYPDSKKIKDIQFAPALDIICKAIGSDNWPISWGADNNLYAAYGDGRGFEPKVPEKLSLGFAKITGTPPNFQGINIQSPTGEKYGDGPSGKKASGMLIVNGVIFMWVRNANLKGEYSQLAWSFDNAKTWKWGFQFPVSFGCPTFLNFGSNYSDARDEYVYIYSQDGVGAYEPYDQIALARVHRTKITDLNSYQYLKSVGNDSIPVWTSNIEQRGSMFKYPNHCFRTEVVYNKGIKRYLMALAYNFDSGWGIFEAPEPWGPWATVFHTEKWDLDKTHGYRLPTKWITDNGNTMHLVFSGLSKGGYDAFCVRRMSLSLFSE
jgi:hypothetical protein